MSFLKFAPLLRFSSFLSTSSTSSSSEENNTLEHGIDNLVDQTTETVSWIQKNVLENGALLRCAFWLLFTFVLSILWRKCTKRLIQKNNTLTTRFLCNALTVVILVVGITAGLSQFDAFSSLLTTVLTSSGIAAIVVGLAAQQSLGNTIDGMYLLASKPFAVGDRIHLMNANITGTIENITTRHTVIRTYNNSQVLVPNTMVNQDIIENSNFSGNQYSSFVDVIIGYESDIAVAHEVFTKVVESHPKIIDIRTEEEKKELPLVQILVRELTIQGISMRATVWTANVGDSFQVCSDIRFKLVQEYQKAKIRIVSVAPFPPDMVAAASATPVLDKPEVSKQTKKTKLSKNNEKDSSLN